MIILVFVHVFVKWLKKSQKPTILYEKKSKTKLYDIRKHKWDKQNMNSYLDKSLRFSLRYVNTPSSSSIISSNWFWSFESIGAIEISLTALNCPQLLRCSFSNRKKFQTNLLLIKIWGWDQSDIILLIHVIASCYV